ncbi:MAG: asparagine synthase (glutamine-hydrolyzing) [Gemmatimonadota bacterium]
MCGIAGVYGNDAPEAMYALTTAIVLDQIKRGPDHHEVEAFGVPGRMAVMGHDRLSILDLSAAGHQPMASTDGRYRIVFNGEIYNYLELRSELAALGRRFTTGTDTEVLLEAFAQWGPGSLERLNGMFAFGLYDLVEHRLWLARDRFGVKPVYYAVRGATVIFASTGAEIARHFGLSANLTYLARGLHYRAFEDNGDIAPYLGLSALPAGYVLSVRSPNGNGLCLESRPYYDLGSRVAALSSELAGESSFQLAQRFDQVLQESVTLRLRADVPVGMSLSGGLDSGAIAAVAATGVPKLTGFCYGRPDAPGSEGPLVAQLARQHRLEIHYCWLESRQEVRDAFWATLQAQDAPFPTGSIVAQFAVFKAARAAGFKVLLGGQGGDESLMGYNKYRLMQLRQLLHSGAYGEFTAAAAALLPVMMASWSQLPVLWQQRKRYRGEGEATRLRLPAPPLEALAGNPREPLWRRQLMDITHISLPTLLRYEDRNSMGNSVESRLPFLDYRLMELSLALPDREKLKSGWGKWILRSVMRGRLPDAIRLNRAKRGFDANDGSWIRSGLGPAIRARLRALRPRLRDLLPGTGAIDTLFTDDQLSNGGFAEAVALLWFGSKN